MKDVAVPIIVTLLTVGGASGLTWLFKALRGQGRVDAAVALTETARKMVDDFEADAAHARTELRQAREESRADVDRLRADLRRCAREAHAIADELRSLRLAVLHPDATIDGLRELVKAGNGGGGENGTVNLRRP